MEGCFCLLRSKQAGSHKSVSRIVTFLLIVGILALFPSVNANPAIKQKRNLEEILKLSQSDPPLDDYDAATEPQIGNTSNTELIGTGQKWRKEHVCNEYKTYKFGNQVSTLKLLKPCTVIEGNLEIKFLQGQITAKNYTDAVFPNLLEVTGYIMFYRVNGLATIGHLFPNLRVIRALEQIMDHGLVLFENEDLASITLPNLQYLGAPVVAMANPQLCYLNTMDWTKVIAAGQKPISAVENRVYEDGCDLVEGCPAQCRDACWDIDNCQQECDCAKKAGTLLGYNPGCDPKGRCCHEQCLGGCGAPGSPLDCYVCKNIFHDGECMEKCPDGLLSYVNRRCVTREECLNLSRHNKFHDGQCLRQCPTGLEDHANLTSDPTNFAVHSCVPCEGKCIVTCDGGTISSFSGAKSLEKCTHVRNFLEISISRPGNSSLLEQYLSQIDTVGHFVKIIRSEFITNLHFLRNLRTIHGYRLDKDKYAFYVMGNDNLEGLWNMDDNSKLTIKEGMMFFQRNPLLCYKQINKLLHNHTIFEGNYSLPNGTVQPITSQAHTKQEISPDSNGLEGDCFNNSMFLEVKYANPLLPMFNFSEFLSDEPRLVISYLIYYKKVGANETVGYYNGKLRCGEEAQAWETIEITKKKPEDHALHENETVYYDGMFTSLDSFSRYAFYVLAYLLEKVNMDGARSEIVYLDTPPSKPSKVRDLMVRPIDIEGNVALQVSWKEPELPFGIIQTYFIYYKKIPWNTDQIYRKNFCDSVAVKQDLGRGTTTTPATTDTVVEKSGGSCKCDDKTTEEKLEDINDASSFKYELENFIQNGAFNKNPKPRSDDNFRRKREAVPLEEVNKYKREVNEGIPAVLTNEPSTTLTPVTTPITTITTTMIDTNSTDPDVDDSNEQPAPIVPSMASVNANVTSAILFDLEPNMEYSIEVVACHAFDKGTNFTRCSVREMSTGRTNSIPKIDIINSTTLKVRKMEAGENGVPIGLILTWEPPEVTNGPILSYTIRYARGADDGTVPDLNEETSTKSYEICVTPNEFNTNNQTFYWYTNTESNNLKPGSTYFIGVSMRTVGTPKGNYTSPKRVEIEPERIPAPKADYLLYVLVPVVIVFLAIGGLVLILWKVKKPKPLPQATLHNSINQDYLDLENAYQEDEWELERSKVKIGKSLGQGAFGMVYEGEARDLYKTDKTPRSVAVKTVNDTANFEDRYSFLKEASRMKEFDCHHIVKLLGVVSRGQPALVIMELMSNGDLKNFLRMHRPDEPDNDGRKPPTLREILQMAAEIADGMAYLANKKFVHRDMAARNCMVAADMTVKIGDFGMTRDIYDSDYYRKGGKGRLPVRWMAPESLRDGVYTSKSDTWSYGIVLWEMATLAAQPYQGFSNEDVLKFVMEGGTMEMPHGCPVRLQEMMKQCWEYYPRYRPTFNQLLEMLQGDVKKSFFSVSWYYTDRDNDHSDGGSDSLDIEDNNIDEHEPLNPNSSRLGSTHSSEHHLHDMHFGDADAYKDEVENVSNKDLVIDVPPALTRPSAKARAAMLYDRTPDEPLLNGHNTSESSDSEDDSPSGSLYNTTLSNTAVSLPASEMSSSGISRGAGPPSYNAALDQSKNTSDSNWPKDSTNSCNGSANGHLHFGNTLTSAC